jgi:peptidyl-dipeptidase Dcp
MSDEITIRHELRCGDLGRIISLHGEAYESLGGYGLRFEAYVGQTIAEYVLQTDSKGRIWLAERSDALVGCAAIILRGEGVAQLRWVVVDPSSRGRSLGRKLMDRSLAYAREQVFQNHRGCTRSWALRSRRKRRKNCGTANVH